MARNKIYIVIPAYNESRFIARVIDDLHIDGYRNIIVVDDNSKDETYQIVSKKDVTLIKHPINLGQGAALKTGIKFALREGAEYIVTFDADGQHDVKDIERLVKPVTEKYDISLGSRFLIKKHNIPMTRVIILKIAVFVQWLFYGLKLTDAHNGLRCLSRKAAKMINFRSNRMEHASEIVEEIKRKRLKYIEIPVNIKYTKDTIQKGHGGLTQAMKVMFKLIFRKLSN